jgi:hypothetical protein
MVLAPEDEQIQLLKPPLLIRYRPGVECGRMNHGYPMNEIGQGEAPS